MAETTTYHRPSTSRSSSENRRNDEELFDKFATLFSPATPRASPIPGASSASSATSARSSSGNNHARPSSLRPVSNSEDPLAILSPSPTYPVHTAVPFDSAKPSSKRPPSNPTLNYFERFGQDAKAAVDRKKNSTLEELLAHQDDPLYWIKRDQPTKVPSPTPQPQPQPATESAPDLLDLTSDVQVPSQPTEGSPSITPTHHFDEDYFGPKSVTSSVRASPDIRHSPLRSTSVLIPTPAPPIESKAPVASNIESSPPSTSSSARNSQDNVSNSSHGSPRPSPYATLSNLSSRFMSSLLPTSGNLPQAPFAPFSRPPLESLFVPSSGDHTPPSLHRSRSSEHMVSSAGPSLRRQTHASSSSDLHITHGTPFAPSVKASSFSPFAAHVYVPPTGAPGYAGERYDWDKGFSRELEQEARGGNDGVGTGGAGNGGRGRTGKGGGGKEEEEDKVKIRAKTLPAGSVSTTNNSNGRGARMNGSATVGNGPGGVVKVIDRKSGGIEFLNRRESTDPVLDLELAERIRSHLPALARLPRKWTLAYSLDQHGISLNTLYTRCEAAVQPLRPGAPTPAGSLLVVRDSDGGVFGAWTGKEGIHLSRGGYYGSGESFLWRYIGENLQIYSWTGRNDYVALCEAGYLSFGGGDGNYGLYLDDTLFEGSSAFCPTFANEPLCSPGPKKAGVVAFECVGLEVWVVGP